MAWLGFYLHACVIEGDEGREQIQVARGEHDSKQDLALSRDTFNRDAELTLLLNHELQNGFMSSLDHKRVSLLNADIYWKDDEQLYGESVDTYFTN